MSIYLKGSCNVSKENDCQLILFIIFTTDCYRFWLHHKGHPLTVLKRLISGFFSFLSRLWNFEQNNPRLKFSCLGDFLTSGSTFCRFMESREFILDHQRNHGALWLAWRKTTSCATAELFFAELFFNPTGQSVFYSQEFYQTKTFAKPNSKSNYGRVFKVI